MKKTNLYVAHGGIGKCVLFSSLIDIFSKRDNNKISIACGFPEVFKFHPKINSAPQWTGGDLRHDIAEYFDDIIFREPYVSQYAKRDRHIVKEWARLFGFDLDVEGMDMQPDLFINPQWSGEAKNIYDKFIQEKFIMLQFTGGQPADNHYVQGKGYTQNAMTQGRNLQNYYDMMLALGEEFSFEECKSESYYASYMIHSEKHGVLEDIQFSEEIENSILEKHLYIRKGESVSAFTGSNKTIGELILQFPNPKKMQEIYGNMENHIKVLLN